MLLKSPLPPISYPADLPVSGLRGDIADAIRAHQVVIVAGATGSGKTTQLPKICLELGRQRIGHTQPRRLAARTIAERIAEELQVDLGALIGYQVRFSDRTGTQTRVKLMTDGILLNEISRDPRLSGYDTLILDEAHERSLNVDFLLGYLKRLLPQRPDLKLVITSATIDPHSFARHFAAPDGSPAPVIEVSGRSFPVEIRYRPLVQEQDEDGGVQRPERDLFEAINAALDELAGEPAGDVLVFLSGESEIRDAEDAIRGRNLPGTEVVPLYGRLSFAEQHRVFDSRRPSGIRRRVVLSTNVAETSLTVPGIRYVIDAGTARISRYSTRSKVQRLPIEAISQASANQRSGRSGRTSDGIAIRLYSEADFAKRPEFTEPEILRTNLASVLLQMIALDLGEIAEFPFLQPPDSRGIKDGLDLLRELGAIGKDGSLTRVGRTLARLPIDPRLGRMVVESTRHGVSREVLAIVAGLSIQDPRERPLEKRGAADQQHARFLDPTSDFLTLLNLWNYLEQRQAELSSSAFRRLCKAEYLNYLRVREWQDVFRQLRQSSTPLKLSIGAPTVNPDGIHRSLLAGLLSQLGVKDTRPATANGGGRTRAAAEYLGARQVRFAIFPGSALAKKPPDGLMSAELVETARLFARTNAAINLAWAEPLAGDLVKRSHGEPHWEKRQGAAVVYQRVTLYGVPIIDRRRVSYATVDAEHARELFLRHALVDGDWPGDISRDPQYSFVRTNRRLLDELAEVEERTRRRDILLDDEAVFDFYAQRLPADVHSVRTFESWWRQARNENAELLSMSRADFLDPAAAAADLNATAFPPAWQQDGQALPLSYRFEPGANQDGVTVQVPLPLLPGLSPAGFDWQVPGFREELVAALIRTLPKAIRRNVVPATDWARRLLAAAPHDVDVNGLPILDFLATEIRRQSYTPVSSTDFDVERIPPHLRMTFAVLDERGRVLARSTDLGALQAKLATRSRDSLRRASGDSRERTGIISWDFGALPQHLETTVAGSPVRAYPALVDEGSSVAIRLFTTEAQQHAAMRSGLRRLLVLSVPSPVPYVQQELTGAEKLALATSPYPSLAALFNDGMAALADAALHSAAPTGSGGLVWTRDDFTQIRDRLNATLVQDLFDLTATVVLALTGYRRVDRALRELSSVALLPALRDAREQADALLYPGFILDAGLHQLRRVPVYFAGLEHRLGRLAASTARDRAWMGEVHTATERYRAAGGTLPLRTPADARLIRARWLLEELRLSLFAQQFPPAEAVSLQRITRLLS